MNTIAAFDPFTDGSFDQLVRGFFRPVRATPAHAAVAIKVDVKETADGYVVQAELPGAKKDDIQVTVEGNQVTIAAQVKRETEQKDGERVLRSERFFGSYYRSFALPLELDEVASNAKYENGVLELTLARKQAAPTRRLTIQ